MGVKVSFSSLRGGPVECTITERDVHHEELHTDCSENGSYETKDPYCRNIIIFPRDDHWAETQDIGLKTGAVDVVLKPIDDLSRPWWLKRLCPDQPAGPPQNINIGIIDRIFEKPEYLDRIVFVEQDEPDFSLRAGTHDDPFKSHGHAVSTILAASNANGFDGLANGAKFFFFDAYPYPEREPEREGDEYQYVGSVAVANGIRRLSTEFDVDIINLSLGFKQHDVDIANEIRRAWDRGCLCVAAAGNDGEGRLSYPARATGVVGVGGIGELLDGAAENSLLHATWEIAKAENAGLCEPDKRWFVDPWSSYGDGLDVVAPSVSVCFPCHHTMETECFGTSFATAIVVGLLAQCLENDKEFVSMARNAKRAAYARDKLFSICSQAGLPMQRRSRYGLPALCADGDA